MALINKLEAIGDAIREKTGSTELLTLDQMATAISGITGGGSEDCNGYHISEEAFTIMGNAQYMFYGGKWDWFIEEFGDKITTKDISYATYMFCNSKVEALSFNINFADGGADCNNMFASSKLESIPSIDFRQNKTHRSFSLMFSSCDNLKEIGTLKNIYPNAMSDMFKQCKMLRYLPSFENINWDRIHTYNYSSLSSMFSECYSLRAIPEDFLKECYGVQTTSSSILYGTFNKCYSLDEVRGLSPQTGALTSNSFSNTFTNCYRLKDVIFKTQEDGTPYDANWKSQTIDLSSAGYETIGVAGSAVTTYNSGITEDKIVTDDTTYAVLKNDPDWHAGAAAYSRYNKISAVNTINSLPDVTSSGGTNTIKFKGAAGELTDGGAINTLTEEEIAVAAAKGWTVTLA